MGGSWTRGKTLVTGFKNGVNSKNGKDEQFLVQPSSSSDIVCNKVFVPGLEQVCREAVLTVESQQKIQSWCCEQGAARLSELLKVDRFQALVAEAGLKCLEAARLKEVLEAKVAVGGSAVFRTSSGVISRQYSGTGSHGPHGLFNDLREHPMSSARSSLNLQNESVMKSSLSGFSFAHSLPRTSELVADALENPGYKSEDNKEEKLRPSERQMVSPRSSLVMASSASTPKHSKASKSHFWEAQLKNRPIRLIFVRHGESEGNIDRKITAHVPDPLLHLTQKGRQQAREAGERLRSIVGGESLRFIVSPYVRTRETTNGLLMAWGEERHKLKVRSDVRIREQEYGNFDREDIHRLHEEKRKFGPFYYRFPDGESPADCYDRASSFLETLYRTWEDNTDKNFVIVSHGLMILVMLMRMMRMSVDEYDNLDSLKNCEFVVLQRPVDDPKFEVAYTWVAGIPEKDYNGLRRRGVVQPPEIWNGDLEAPVLNNHDRRSSSIDEGHLVSISSTKSMQ